MQLFLIKTFPQHRWAQLTLNMRIGTCFHKISCNLSFLSLLCRNCVSLNSLINWSDIDLKVKSQNVNMFVCIQCSQYLLLLHMRCTASLLCRLPFMNKDPQKAAASICTARMSQEKLAKKGQKITLLTLKWKKHKAIRLSGMLVKDNIKRVPCGKESIYSGKWNLYKYFCQGRSTST